MGMAFLVNQQDWFGASSYFSSITYILGAYFIVSIIVTGWLVARNRREDRQVSSEALA
jgi:preprotein translocase subunit SecG